MSKENTDERTADTGLYGYCPFSDAFCNAGSGCQLWNDAEGKCTFRVLAYDVGEIMLSIVSLCRLIELDGFPVKGAS